VHPGKRKEPGAEEGNGHDHGTGQRVHLEKYSAFPERAMMDLLKKLPAGAGI
jgi:hypothetical protein